MNSNDFCTLGAGCFWCVEAVFTELKGVTSVKSGFMGGKIPNPSYEDVCTGNTGHAEVARIEFDSEKISFSEILEVFFQTHDPTTLNKQGGDIGTQYRSAIFHHNKEQESIAADIINNLNSSKAYNSNIVTELSAATTFYPAEDYHNDYLKNNPGNPYCQMVVRPKVDKFKKAFSDKLK